MQLAGRLASTLAKGTAMPPFPIALCGKNPTLASQFVKMMDEGGEFQVVTVFHTTPQATSTLHSLLSPSQAQPPTPPPSLGSNAALSPDEKHIAPKAIIVGAGFSDDEVEVMRKDLGGVSEADKLAWFTPEPGKMRGLRPGGDGFMEAVVGRARDALRERRKSAEEDGVEAGVFGF